MRKIGSLFIAIHWILFSVSAQTIDPELATKLQFKLDSFRAANNLKGISACVMSPGLGTWKGVTGISHPGTPISSDLLFGIASNTKLFTGVLLLKLAENSIISLEDELHEYLPTFDHIDSTITIRQLLNHTSGLDDVTSVTGYPDSILSNPNRIFTAPELMTWIGPPLFPAGSNWGYCNTNYLLAGMIAEQATGKPFYQLLRDSILTPLQLDSTFLDVYETIPFTVAHPWQGGVNSNTIPRVALNSAAWTAGAMYSTAGEMAQWYNALLNGQFLNTSSLTEMTTFVGSGNYGIGISRAIVNGRTVWTHGGTIWGGYNSSMMYEPSTGIVICVLINQLPAQAYQVSIQLLSTIINHTVSATKTDPKGTIQSVYPNPTDGIVHIDIPDQAIQAIKVYDSQGRLIKEATKSQFTLSGYPNGKYWILVQTAESVYYFPVLKQ